MIGSRCETVIERVPNSILRFPKIAPPMGTTDVHEIKTPKPESAPVDLGGSLSCPKA